MEHATPRTLIAALHAFGLERDRLRAALAQRLALVPADLDALEHLELAGSLAQRDLATRLLLTSGAVTQLVDRLERAGLVIRRNHESDRRISMVELAPNAELPDVPELDRYHAALRSAAAAMTPAARGQTVAFLATVTASAATSTRELRRP